MVMKVVDMRGGAAPAAPSQEPMASPAQARSVAALFAAIGATPDEIDGAVAVQIELQQRATAPRSYKEILESPIAALAEYRRRQQTFTVVEEEGHA